MPVVINSQASPTNKSHGKAHNDFSSAKKKFRKPHHRTRNENNSEDSSMIRKHKSLASKELITIQVIPMENEKILVNRSVMIPRQKGGQDKSTEAADK